MTYITVEPCRRLCGYVALLWAGGFLVQVLFDSAYLAARAAAVQWCERHGLEAVAV